MSGICGDEEEQPANRSDNRIIATATIIINTWWYPTTGTNRAHLWAKGTAIVFNYDHLGVKLLHFFVDSLLGLREGVA